MFKLNMFFIYLHEQNTLSMKKAMLALMCFICSTNVFADHIQGGNIKTYYNGTNYTIDLSLYRDCRGITFGSADNVSISSTSLGIIRYKLVTMVSSDTVNPGCAVASTCTSFSATTPGWEIFKFSDTVNLPPANDWVISYANFARNMAVMNLSGGTSGIYVDSRLNNSTGINSNAQWAGKINYYLMQGTAMSYPLQVVDGDGDSIDVRVISARENSTGTPVPYMPGYSATNPFGGGYYTINNTTHTIDMLCPNVGIYTVAVAVDEYRNGNFVGTSTHDFEIFCFPTGTPGYTLPTPNAATNFEFYTCPGQTNSVLLNFDDVITDSVFVTVNAPSLAGWTFSPSYSSGLGSGSVSLTYTSPISLNPATTPYVYVPLSVRDNACPRGVVDYMIVIKTQACGADSVWPGDANNDKIVNLYDPLYVALAYGDSGPARPGATTTWTGQACNNWANSFPLSGVNHKHADCDGDGTVGASDFAPIISNYGNVHLREEQRTNSGIPLRFDVSGIYFGAGSHVSVPIKLGDAGNTVNLFGIASRVSINGVSLQSPATIYNYVTWIGNTTNTYSFTKELNNNTIDWAQSRIDNTQITGDGTIGTLEFTVPANTPFGTMVTLDFGSTLMIDADGNEIPQASEEAATIMVQWPTSVGNVNEPIQHVAVVPNPSHNNANLIFNLQNKGSVAIDITDVTGKRVWHHESKCDNGNQTIKLPANDIANGLYLIQMSSNGEKLVQGVKWNKQ
jgi:hypothetical protein